MAEAPKKGRLTLYQDLLSEQTLAEMKAKDAATQAEEASKKKHASLMFKPTNLGKKSGNSTTKPAGKPKPKSTFPPMQKVSSSTSAPLPSASSPESQPQQLSSTPQQQPQPSQKRGFSDWLANEDAEWEYYERKHERGGNKKQKKKGKQQHQQQLQAHEETWAWEDIYDPRVPVSFLDYPKSEVQYDISEAWKQRLYEARKKSIQRQEKPVKRNGSDQPEHHSQQFEPPNNLDFAPPSSDALPLPARAQVSERAGHDNGRPSFLPAPAASSKVGAAPSQNLSSAVPASLADAAKAKVAAQIAAMKAKALATKTSSSGNTTQPSQTSALEVHAPTSPPPPPPEEQDGIISAAPTFNPDYAAWKSQQEPGFEETSESTEDAQAGDIPRSNRPGQAGFAEKYLAKHGYEKGKGLGASGQGITTAIIAKAQKRKKLPDSAGGGFAVPANMGKIVGGKKNAKEADDGPDGAFGAMSEVIKLEGIFSGLDVDKEVQDNNTLQEIGDEMGDFGQVERLFVWREHMGGRNEVFVKFTSQLSALRAVREMDGGEFAGNVVKARFWDAEAFEKGEYV